MEKIYLSKREKEVLRLLSVGEGCPSDYPGHVFASCVQSLELKGLAEGMWATGHILVAARLTSYGETYLALNPDLRNPLNWNLILSVATIISIAISIIALFEACAK